jgi:hypothetical protein
MQRRGHRTWSGRLGNVRHGHNKYQHRNELEFWGGSAFGTGDRDRMLFRNVSMHLILCNVRTQETVAAKRIVELAFLFIFKLL